MIELVWTTENYWETTVVLDDDVDDDDDDVDDDDDDVDDDDDDDADADYCCCFSACGADVTPPLMSWSAIPPDPMAGCRASACNRPTKNPGFVFQAPQGSSAESIGTIGLSEWEAYRKQKDVLWQYFSWWSVAWFFNVCVLLW